MLDSIDRTSIARAYEENQAWPPEVTEGVARYFLSSLPAVPRRCLVLGSATGANDALPLARIANAEDRILAGDLEPAFLDRLRERAVSEGLRNVEAHKLDITEDLSPWGRFHLVSLLFVIHRLKAWEEVIGRLCGLVAPGGSFFISEFVGPSGIIYLSNENGGAAGDPVSRLIRRYFELLPERFAPALRSTSIGPVLDRLGKVLKPAGHRDFTWRQSITPGEMLRRIADRAYAPYFSIHPPPGLLEQLRGEFAPEAARRIPLEETIRLYRFERDAA
ncbi:MAG TPA: class I SAM-dependent methyltransferase [Planctomycetota bacterium]|jgi:SAM-dependent methyltransferase|nr:class I SAM-dependent methyltransferase [Planctomycetota bacterium]